MAKNRTVILNKEEIKRSENLWQLPRILKDVPSNPTPLIPEERMVIRSMENPFIFQIRTFLLCDIAGPLILP